jgi:hypothetical protein
MVTSVDVLMSPAMVLEYVVVTALRAAVADRGLSALAPREEMVVVTF